MVYRYGVTGLRVAGQWSFMLLAVHEVASDGGNRVHHSPGPQHLRHQMAPAARNYGRHVNRSWFRGV